MVSCIVPTALSPAPGVSVVEAWALVEGLSSIKALDVFFCRSAHDCEPILSIAAFADDSRVNL